MSIFPNKNLAWKSIDGNNDYKETIQNWFIIKKLQVTGNIKNGLEKTDFFKQVCVKHKNDSTGLLKKTIFLNIV